MNISYTPCDDEEGGGGALAVGTPLH